MYQKVLKKVIFTLFSLLILILIFSWNSYKVNPLDIFNYLGAEVGKGVGMSVGIPENPFSNIARQLEEEESRLKEKERTLQEKESLLEKRIISGNPNDILSLILGVIIILFVLVLLNFYLDYKNRNQNFQKEENN